MDLQIVADNTASRERLRELVSRLDEASFQQPVDEGWTVAGILAHLAFWDQSCLVRWDGYVRDGEMVGFSDALIEVVNEASLPIWLALPGRVAADLALQAAEAVDDRIEALPDDAVDHATRRDLRYTLQRSGHRTEHLDEIEVSLGR